MINKIMKDEWYKTATNEQMRIALMHVEQYAIDRLFSELAEKKKDVRDIVFQECAKDCDF